MKIKEVFEKHALDGKMDLSDFGDAIEDIQLHQELTYLQLALKAICESDSALKANNIIFRMNEITKKLKIV